MTYNCTTCTYCSHYLIFDLLVQMIVHSFDVDILCTLWAYFSASPRTVSPFTDSASMMALSKEHLFRQTPELKAQHVQLEGDWGVE